MTPALSIADYEYRSQITKSSEAKFVLDEQKFLSPLGERERALRQSRRGTGASPEWRRCPAI
jgi:hypothetical protein